MALGLVLVYCTKDKELATKYSAEILWDVYIQSIQTKEKWYLIPPNSELMLTRTKFII